MQVDSALVVGFIAIAGIVAAFFWRNQQARFYHRQYQMERERRSLAQRYECLTRYANDIILLADRDMRIVEANDQALRAYGYSREELLRLHFRDLHPKETQADLETRLQHVGEEGLIFESVHRRHDGTTFTVEISSTLMDVEGEKFYQKIIRDITERKQAEEALKRRQAVLAGINRVFQEALSCETKEKLGETCLAVAEELTGSKFGFIGQVNQTGHLDDIAISYLGWQACKIPGTEKLVLPKNFLIHGIYGVCLREGRSEIANDPVNHPDSIGVPEGHPPITAFLGVPLKYAGKTTGMIGLGNKEGGYTDADREAVEALAPAIVEAFKRKQAEEELRESEQQQLYLAGQLLTAQERERRRIAMDLHDDLGQSLMTLKLHLQAIDRKIPANLAEVRKNLAAETDTINAITDNVRRLARDLHPSMLEDLGLFEALTHLFQDFSEHHGVKLSLNLDDISDVFYKKSQINIYRVFQECLTNIAKYAKATLVSIDIKKKDDQVSFVIEDNGKGFDAKQVLAGRSDRGLGLAAIEERINIMGGSMEIWSQPGQGTRISFMIPVTSLGPS